MARREPRSLPAVNLFRTFDAAVRRGSFREAAGELCITPSAVSQQIQRLEEALGVKLFRRLPRRIELTRHGTSLASAVQEALVMLQTACEHVTQERDRVVLCVNASPGIGAAWLIGRLPAFRARHPEIGIVLQSANEQVDFRRQDVDVAIRWGNGRFPSAQATRLGRAAVFPVCSPDFRDRWGLYGREDLAILREVVQLHVTTHGNTWSDWLAAAGHGSIAFRDIQHFSDATLMLEAAVQGHGICLASYLLVEDHLRSGRLVQPIGVELAVREGYYVLVGADAEEPALRFRAWVLEEAKRSLSRRPGPPTIGGGILPDATPQRLGGRISPRPR
ncbi:MAG: LysR family transcriptional regulator [Rhodospirillales bacterium]|nr:LysR family transcriptional regulator [Rhodospirillales bacterium]MBN8897727.1 LysR family transcriptional regulator [Rhodospirillales bacterium]